MAYEYIPLGQPGESPSTPPRKYSRSRIRQLVLCGTPFLSAVLLLHVLFGSSTIPFKDKFFTPSKTIYKPGKLGKRLLSRQRSVIGSSNTEDWEVLFSDPSQMADEMFDIMAGRDESKCEGWSPEKAGGPPLEGRSNWDHCWRAKMYEQSLQWDMEDADFWVSLKDMNTHALDRLRRCLSVPPSELPEYPNYTSENPYMPLNLTTVDTPVAEDTRPCSLTSTKVILGQWWYFTMAFADWTESPGEVIWLRNQIRALYELGYTIIATNTYAGMVHAHRTMPDVISTIWTEDRHTLTCQDDPKCILFSTFRPTNEKYPGTGIDESRHVPDFWDAIYADADGPPPQRWAWLSHEVSSIKEEERGTIPGWKLFTTTYWGARPEDPDWDFTREEFAWNELGQQWTLTPFDYPHHTYIPYSIEKVCRQVPFIPHTQKEDRLFILAKQNAYFHGSAVPNRFWSTVRNRTGLQALSVSEGEDPLPLGIDSVGHVGREEFEIMVGKSKLMVGIGRPLISPSVYSALCQGTPVVMPYFREKAVMPGWDLFNGAYAQHGPAAAIGPPYVYSYKSGDMDDLEEKIKKAAATPIQRYIPEEMTFKSELKNMDDLMRFDWKKHGELIQETGSDSHSQYRRHVIARCFKIGRCRPINGELPRS